MRGPNVLSFLHWRASACDDRISVLAGWFWTCTPPHSENQRQTPPTHATS